MVTPNTLLMLLLAEARQYSEVVSAVVSVKAEE